jgi:hypothetical protein
MMGFSRNYDELFYKMSGRKNQTMEPLRTLLLGTSSIPVLRAHFANLLAQGYLSLALILLSIFSFIRALAHALVVYMRYIFIHAHALEHAKWN